MKGAKKWFGVATLLQLLLHYLALRGRSPRSQKRPHNSRAQDKWKTGLVLTQLLF